MIRGFERCLAVALLTTLSLASGLRAGQQPGTPAPPATSATGTGIIAGQVLDAAHRGVEGAVVTLGGGFRQLGLSLVADPLPSGPRRALTNADGRFAFFDLPGGGYSMTVTKAGYIDGAYGRLRIGGPAQTLTLADGERNITVAIPIWSFAAISGTVLDEMGEPAVNVAVRAYKKVVEAGRQRIGASLSGASDPTDDQGNFRLDNLAPGDYVVAVLSTQMTFPTEFVDVGVQVALDGQVGAFYTRLIGAGLTPGRNPTPPARRHGDWVLQSSIQTMPPPLPSPDGRLSIYPTTFLPGVVSTSQATVVRLESGDERTGLVMQLRPVPATTVSGIVIGPDGPVANAGVRLMPSYADELSAQDEFDVATSYTTSTGAFRFLGVPAGQYAVRVLKMPTEFVPAAAPRTPETRTLYADLPIAVGEEGIANLRVNASGGIRVMGRMNFDGNTLPKPSPDVVKNFTLRFSPAIVRSGDQRQFPAAVDRDGRITSLEMPPGRYTAVFQAFAEDRLKMPGWETIGGTIDGQDVSNKPFDFRSDVSNLVMTLTDHPNELTGTVRNAEGRPDENASVILFWADRSTWSDNGGVTRSIRSFRTTRSGTFLVRSVPPGDYFLAAISDADAGDFPNPEFLERVSRVATRMQIAVGDKKSVDLTTRSIR